MRPTKRARRPWSPTRPATRTRRASWHGSSVSGRTRSSRSTRARPSSPDRTRSWSSPSAPTSRSSPALAGFLDLPERCRKPRERGLTHVLDKGLSTIEAEGLIEVSGPSLDLVKLGWGTAVVTANLEPKLRTYARAEIPVVLGGTLTEIALRDGRIDGLIAWLHELGIRHVEISDGTLAIEHSEKLDLIRRLAGEFTVLSEGGSKDAEQIMAPYRWVEQIETELDAGAWKVITESRETGSAGIYRPDGEVRMGLIDEIAHAVDADKLLFEAPRKDQQVWFIKRFGRELNLGNIAPRDVLSLETLRLGLRSDTVGEL